MRKILSLMAIIAGAWLVYSGYERQHSLAGKADDSLSRLGQKIDGQGYATAHVKYYVAGLVLLAGGAMGLGLARK
jgi:hypothetical protein